MLLNKTTTKNVNRTVFAGLTYTITLLKRSNDQREGTVVSLKLFRCRRGMVLRTGEPLQAEMTSSHRTTWHIPLTELQRVGVSHLNSADRLLYKKETWQPESDTLITEKLFDNEICLDCLRCDPPNQNG